MNIVNNRRTYIACAANYMVCIHTLLLTPSAIIPDYVYGPPAGIYLYKKFLSILRLRLFYKTTFFVDI